MANLIKDNLDIEFIISDNPCRYIFLPTNEIWLSMYLHPSDYSCIIVHEIIENLLVKSGFSYNFAYIKANKFEYILRKMIDSGEIKIENNNDALKYAKLIIEDFTKNHEFR